MRFFVNMKSEKYRRRFSMTVTFSVIVFCVLLAAVACGALVLYILTKTGVIGGFDDQLSFGTLLFAVFAFSLVTGAVISLLIALVPLRPVNELITHMNKLAAGDYKSRVEYTSNIGNHKVFAEIKDSLNKLAEELENTEMLRSDFINNFSHEFKTPIVSIAGLAKLLNNESLSDEDRSRYLGAIEEESRRLSAMATNVLNLTKVENQSILTEITVFNLSEQLRACILLLEDKWSRKNVNLDINMDEHTIEANYELLKEVWINLVDNAVKFTTYRGTVAISVTDNIDSYTVSIGNTGDPISDEDKIKIFSKFYQIDKSHASRGNGIGLAIVKRIVELHRGNVAVENKDGMVVFEITLPKKPQN